MIAIALIMIALILDLIISFIGLKLEFVIAIINSELLSLPIVHFV